MYVYANCEAVVYENGLRIQLVVDQIWEANDPLVKARPDLFSTEPRKVNRTSAPKAAPVESASAAPGEKRTTRRAQ